MPARLVAYRRRETLWSRARRLWDDHFGGRAAGLGATFRAVPELTPPPPEPAPPAEPAPPPPVLPKGLPDTCWPGPSTLPRLAEASAELRSLIARLGHSRQIEERWTALWTELAPGLGDPRAPEAASLGPLLERLGDLVAAVPSGPAAERAPAVIAALSRLRHALRRPGGHLAAPLAALAQAIESWQDGLAEAARRHRTLGGVLLPLAQARHLYGLGHPLPGEAATTFRTTVRRPIRRYLDSSWLHDRWLTAYCLATLLAADLLALPAPQPGPTALERGGPSDRSGPSAGERDLLGRVWEEAAAGQLDRRETRRRLRRLEAAGVYIDSLALALLRLPDAAPTALQGSDRAASADPAAARASAELPPDGWPGGRDPEALAYETPQLAELLRRLGYCPEAERRWPGLRRELEEQIHTEIPDFAAFRATLVRVDERLAAASAAPPPGGDPVAVASHARRDDPLLCAVLAAGDDEAAVLAALDRDPVRRLLPFVEEIPFSTGGQVAWRTPVDVPALHKRPRDPAVFRQLLGELERLVAPAQTERQGRARQEVMDALERIDKALAQGGTYLPAPLRALEAKVDAWLNDCHAERSAARRRALESLLADLIEARHHWGANARGGTPKLEAPEANAFRATAQEHARRYLAAGWAHTPWLTTYTAANLLASELAALRLAGAGEPPPAGAALERVWREVATGSYDAGESIRRLRGLEEHGVYVHSQAFALLRLTADSTSGEGEPWRS